MQLTIYNGSPRAQSGNTEIFINKFLEGFNVGENKFSVNYLMETYKMREFVGKFQNAENVLIAFPLYADSMPGIVMEFFEALQDKTYYTEHHKIGFLIHCGFPETVHLEAIDDYLERLAHRLGFQYLGTIARGGSEGIHVMPEKANKNLFNNLIELGNYFSKFGKFDSTLLDSIRNRKKFPAFAIPFIKILNGLGLFDGYWNKKLKKNRAYKKRFLRPYE